MTSRQRYRQLQVIDRLVIQYEDAFVIDRKVVKNLVRCLNIDFIDSLTKIVRLISAEKAVFIDEFDWCLAQNGAVSAGCKKTGELIGAGAQLRIAGDAGIHRKAGAKKNAHDQNYDQYFDQGEARNSAPVTEPTAVVETRSRSCIVC